MKPFCTNTYNHKKRKNNSSNGHIPKSASNRLGKRTGLRLIAKNEIRKEIT